MITKGFGLPQLTTLMVVLISVWSIRQVMASSISQGVNQQKNQLMHPLLGQELYNSLRGVGYSDGNKIRGYNGGGINMIEANGNIKRARKISTFMPMRGRKNGSGAHGPGATLENLMNAYSVLPLIKQRLLESAMARQQEQLDMDEQQRQLYYNDNLSQYNDDQQRQQQLLDQSVHSIGEPTNFSRFFDADENGQAGSGQSSQLIQNKLRRAFHPMRGKKSIMDEYTPVDLGQSDPLPTLVY